MRPQFNIALDDYPELPEKIRKLCKVRGYRISDFCARVLNDAVNREASELVNNESIEQPNDRIKKIEDSIDELRQRVDNIQSTQTTSDNRKLIEQLGELLDNEKYPQNNSSKIKKRILEIMASLS
ncbi:MAG: hypothetical protein KME29_12220 [Calothrix sp. FI2-JRJ7]|jgi:predicted  nucleic acid-binding Zn-ribbon protein|nr:hypothetical protein [Calothrix sp. FI2-JRJ7]